MGVLAVGEAFGGFIIKGAVKGVMVLRASRAARAIGLGYRNTARALRTASEAYKGTTRLGHSLQKHTMQAENIWGGKLLGRQSTFHEQAMVYFREIMKGPGGFKEVVNAKGISFLEKMLPDGRGIRLQMDYRFKGFIQ